MKTDPIRYLLLRHPYSSLSDTERQALRQTRSDDASESPSPPCAEMSVILDAEENTDVAPPLPPAA